MTYEQFAAWFGSNNIDDPQQLIALILELANGQYPVDEFNQDVAERGMKKL